MKVKIIILISILIISVNTFSQQIGDGRAIGIDDFSVPLKSGGYQGYNPIGANPDLGNVWQHLFIIRHSNDTNNYQLQLSSSYASNDRLFFRKLAFGSLGPANPTWIELATRGANTFLGNQIVNGDQNITGNLVVGKDTETTMITGSTNSGAIQIKSHSGLGGSQNRYLRLGWKDNNSHFAPVVSINDDLNVGIGTTTPAAKLEVNGTILAGINGTVLRGRFSSVYPSGSANSYFDLRTNNEDASNGGMSVMTAYAGNMVERLTIKSAGNVGIGTTSPSLKMVVSQDITSNTDLDVAQFGIMGSTDNRKRLVMGYDVNGDGFGFIKSGFYGVKWTNLSLQPTGGNVGIGTTSPDEKLTVNGTIHATEVKVTSTVPVPDYVFSNDYKLKTLQEVEAYIKQNSHLPEIPSAKEIEKNGLMLAEMNMALLKKMEELTLYMIEQNKQIKKQQKENNTQSQKIETLEKENDAFKSLSERLSKIEEKLK